MISCAAIVDRSDTLPRPCASALVAVVSAAGQSSGSSGIDCRTNNYSLHSCAGRIESNQWVSAAQLGRLKHRKLNSAKALSSSLNTILLFSNLSHALSSVSGLLGAYLLPFG